MVEDILKKDTKMNQKSILMKDLNSLSSNLDQLDLKNLKNAILPGTSTWDISEGSVDKTEGGKLEYLEYGVKYDISEIPQEQIPSLKGFKYSISYEFSKGPKNRK